MSATWVCPTCGEAISDAAVGPQWDGRIRTHVGACFRVTAEPTPAFTEAAERTLDRCAAVFDERGAQYGDTWHTLNLVTTFLDVTWRRLTLPAITLEQKRLIYAAALIDLKDTRLAQGGWLRDSLDDGINYRAAFATWIEEA